MHHVIEIAQPLLLHAESEVAGAGEGVAEVVKQHAADILSNQRKPQLGLVEKHRVAADGKAGFEVARPGLVLREGAVGRCAAAVEALRQRNRVRFAAGEPERGDVADLGRARQHQLAAQRMVSRIARQHADEIALRAENVFGEIHVERIIDALARVERIVAPVLDEVEGNQPQPHRLRQQRNQLGRNLQRGLVHVDRAIGVAVEQRERLADALFHLDRDFAALERKRAHVLRIVVARGESEHQLVVALEARPIVIEHRLLFERREPRAQAHRVRDAPQIGPRETERNARRKTGLPGRRVQAIHAAADARELGAHADRQRIAPRLLQIVDHVLPVRVSLRILNRHVDARKHAQVV